MSQYSGFIRSPFAVVFFFVVGSVCLHSTADDDIIEIKSVEKWHHLFSQKEIKGDDYSARLGINSTRVAAGHGVILFCLTEGFDPGRVRKSQTVGPFTYRVQYEREKRLFHSMDSLALGQEGDFTDCTLIFKQVIPFSRPGRATICVFGEDKVNPVAQVKVEVVDNQFHRWIPFGPTQRLRFLQKADGKYDAVGYVSIGTNRTAVPIMNGHYPIIYQSPGKDGKTKTHLNPMAIIPNLTPTSGRLEVKQTSEGFAIHSKDEIVLSNPESRFLARWWINGEPYVPKAEAKQFLQQLTGKVVTGKKYHLICKTRAEYFGGKKTDKLEVQILYSNHGWKEFEAMEKLATISNQKGDFFLISNRLKLK